MSKKVVIKGFETKNGELHIIDSEGKAVNISGYKDSERQKYEKNNDVKIHDMISEFCESIDSNSKKIIEIVEQRGLNGVPFEFYYGSMPNDHTIIFNALIYKPDSSNEFNVRLIYDKIGNSVSPSVNISGGQYGDRCGVDVFRHFGYHNLYELKSYVDRYINEGDNFVNKLIENR